MSTPHSSWPPAPSPASVSGADELDTWPGRNWAATEDAPPFEPRGDAITEPLPRIRLGRGVPLHQNGRDGGARHPGSGGPPVAGLIAGVGVVVVLVGVVAAVVLAQIFGAQHAPARATQRAPVATATPLPTATPTPSPTATPIPANSATFAAADTTTQGTWQGTYGATGYAIAGDAVQLPPAIQVTGAGASGFVWAASTADPRALQKATNPADRVAACWYAPTSFSIDVTISDGQAHQLALYLLDWDQQNRVETVTILDATSGALLDARSVMGFAGGQYLVWTVRGHVTIQVTNGPGSINAVVGGIFFT